MTQNLVTQPLIPIDLHCEYRTNPLGIDVALPRFGWALDGGPRGATQLAWQVQVGTAPGLADAWDSGRVAGDRQLGVVYAGAPLAARTRYYWRVRAWDAASECAQAEPKTGAGAEGSWSAPAWFETAYFSAADFAGEWIGLRVASDDERLPLAAARWIAPATDPGTPLAACGVRFALPQGAEVRRAVLHCFTEGHDQPWGCGVYQYLSVNGTQPDSAGNLPRLAPMTYDIAPWLRPGDNHVALKWWRQPGAAFIGLVEVELADGTVLRIPTGQADSGWRVRGAAKRHPDPGWDDPNAADWTEPADVAAFGAGPWPADDRRNRADRLLAALELHRAFDAPKSVARARIYATACGVYELRLNGAPVGDRVLAPGWTEYRSRVHYQTYDVTDQVRAGGNELDATVGDGWWSGHLATPFGCSYYGTEKALKLALHLDYADGTSEVIATDTASWKGRSGAVRLADLMDGQTTDLSRPADAWRAPVAVAAPAGCLQAQPDEPIRRLCEFPVRSLTEKRPGVFIIDFGQNLVGWVRLAVRAPRGTVITVRHAEVLDLHGEVWVENLRSALAVDRHICSGGDDVFEPTLTFHGFRYAEVSGLPGGLRPEQVAAVVIGSDTPDRGTFSCDNPLLNRLQANIRWGQRGNFVSVPTDCPQRDERMGWSADTQVFARTAVFNADCAAFYAKYVDDLIDGQSDNGAFPDYAPTQAKVNEGHFGWADAGIVMPHLLWRAYGDTRVVEHAWDAMRRYLDHRDAGAKDDLNTTWSFGDWVSPAPQTPNEVLGPIYHAWMHRLMAEMAEGLGKADDAAHHRARFAAVTAAWRNAHLASDGRIATSDTQAAYVCALRAGVVQPQEVATHLVRAVERFNWHLNTGFLGTYCLLPALTQAGRSGVAWRILLQETAPGWLYTVKCDATTMWERWNSYSPETGPVNIGNMNSYNHYAFGAVGEWIYANVLGIERRDDDIAFQRLVVHPEPGGCCRHARGEYRSLRGTVRVAWWLTESGKDGASITLDVAVPPNCTAEVHVPTSRGGAAVREGGAPVAEARGIRHLRDYTGHAVFAVGAGEYRFKAQV